MGDINLPLRDLQKIILGTRKEPLSVIEIRNLFSYPTTPESILYIITALNRKKIDSNTTLIQGITNATDKEDLVPIALSLRYGGDPNLYVNSPNIGDIHILGYIYLILSKKDSVLLNSIVIMLMIMGSNPTLPIFDSRGGVIRDEFSLVEPIKGQSILDWLDNQGFDTIIPQISNQNYSKVDKKFLTMLGTFLDKEKLLRTDPRLDEIVGAHSTNIFNKHYMKVDKNQGLRVSRTYLNITTFEKFVDLGASLSYSDINDLILSIENYKNIGDLISMAQIRQMLIYIVSNGAILDNYQAELLKKDENIYNRIFTIYSQPYWKKVCQNCQNCQKSREVESPDKLKLLAYRLNLYPETSKDVLCYQIQQLSQVDPEQLKKSAIARQKARISTISSKINEFVNGQFPSIECSNRSVLKGDIYDYPDADIAFYTDDQGSLWCFTSNNFTKIIDQKKNPYTNQQFPQDFLDMVERKVEFISRYRSIDELPISISKTIDTLTEPDEFNNIFTDKNVALFNEMMKLNGITEWNIDKLSNRDLEDLIFTEFEITTNLVELDREHAIKTFKILSYNKLLENPSLTIKFFKQIEEKSITKNKSI